MRRYILANLPHAPLMMIESELHPANGYYNVVWFNDGGAHERRVDKQCVDMTADHSQPERPYFLLTEAQCEVEVTRLDPA